MEEGREEESEKKPYSGAPQLQLSNRTVTVPQLILETPTAIAVLLRIKMIDSIQLVVCFLMIYTRDSPTHDSSSDQMLPVRNSDKYNVGSAKPLTLGT